MASQPMAASQALRMSVGTIYTFQAIVVTLNIFVWPKMAAEPGGLSIECLSSCQAFYWVGFALFSKLLLPRIDTFRNTYCLLAFALSCLYATTVAQPMWTYGLCVFFTGALPVCGQSIYLLLAKTLPEGYRECQPVCLNILYSALMGCVALVCSRTQGLGWRSEMRLWYCPFLFVLLVGVLFVPDAPTQIHCKQLTNNSASKTVRRSLWGRTLGVRMAATCLCWSACSISYFGLSYSAGGISANIYTNVMAYGVIDVFAYLCASVLMTPLGARNTQFLSLVVATAALFACGLALPNSWLLFGCALVGRLFVNIAFTTIFVLLVSTFPEECRFDACGYANVFARLSTLIAPFCGWLPAGTCCIFLSLIVLAAAGATVLLPGDDQTQQDLPDLLITDPRDDMHVKDLRVPLLSSKILDCGA